MIELPKYTVPTYDPHALAPNQHTDFTRRIPTGFTQRQLDRDARIIQQIVRAYDEGGPMAAERVLDIYLRKTKLLTNPRYWEVMRTVWVAAGSTETADIFRTMMRSARPCRSWFMTPEDAQALDAMQFPLTVWRAYDVKYIDDLPHGTRTDSMATRWTPTAAMSITSPTPRATPSWSATPGSTASGCCLRKKNKQFLNLIL